MFISDCPKNFNSEFSKTGSKAGHSLLCNSTNHVLAKEFMSKKFNTAVVNNSAIE